ncbi:amidohydrolase family protein [Sphingomonas sp. IC-11]|uniref:amidohydrolase family protein n=1 Tax=Sphingomonas sp. IC-11 TaxID=2898528 RepID=UPI001E31B94B|nr:amidohydrolase family protein [Sphingomonas sp. IC-11]MCD2317200.1 amidohydrolase family protein [Sphingomonas sp. IC-11]
MAALAVAVPTTVQAAPATEAAAAAILYRHATLIDGTGGPALPGMTVVTRGERVEAVLADAKVTADMLKGAEIVDLTGRFLLPGLIDSHQHIATPPNRRRAEALMRRDLYSGITATRIMADDLRSVAEIARAAVVGEIASPDLHYAALFAGPSFFDDPRTLAVSAGVKPGTGAWMQAVDDRSDLPLAVARAKGTGATAIKIYANLPADLIARITKEAHRQDMQVWAHGMVFPTPPADVIAAGPDVVSHTCYLAYQAVDKRPATYQQRVAIDPAPFIARNNPVMAGLFATMRERGMLLDATLRVYQEGEKRARTGGGPAYCSLDLAAALTAQAHQAGVEISAGTDGDTEAGAPYPGLFEELELLVGKAGFKAAEAIRAATLIGAKAMGQEADIGTVAPGKLANMVVLTRNPLTDIANMRSVLMTVKRGRAYHRDDFKPVTAEELGRD